MWTMNDISRPAHASMTGVPQVHVPEGRDRGAVRLPVATEPLRSH